MDKYFTPVWSFTEGTIAIFFNSWDAIDFINSQLGQRNLYLGVPMERPHAAYPAL